MHLVQERKLKGFSNVRKKRKCKYITMVGASRVGKL